MNDSTRRAIRSFVQIGIVEAFLRLLEAFGVHITEDQHAAIIVFVTPILVLVQNLIEDTTNFPAFLKAPASSGENPQPDPHGIP